MNYQEIFYTLWTIAALSVELQVTKRLNEENKYYLNKYKIQDYNREEDKLKFRKYKNDFIDIFKDAKELSKIKHPILKGEDIQKLNNLEYIIENEDIIKFYQTLKSQTEPYNLINFYNNIQTLKINNQEETIKKETPEGSYVELGNYIPLSNTLNYFKSSQNYKETLYHELLHVASTNRKINLNGFILILTYDHNLISIGRGLNEGYTETLCKRFLKADNSKTYLKLQKLSNLIESFYSNPKDMETDYFNANLYNLIIELSQKMTVEEAIDIIIDMDYIYYHPQDYSFYKKTISKIINLYQKSHNQEETKNFKIKVKTK